MVIDIPGTALIAVKVIAVLVIFILFLWIFMRLACKATFRSFFEELEKYKKGDKKDDV